MAVLTAVSHCISSSKETVGTSEIGKFSQSFLPLYFLMRRALDTSLVTNQKSSSQGVAGLSDLLQKQGYEISGANLKYI